MQDGDRIMPGFRSPQRISACLLSLRASLRNANQHEDISLFLLFLLLLEGLANIRSTVRPVIFIHKIVLWHNR